MSAAVLTDSREQRAIEQFNDSVPKQLLRDLFVSILTNYQQADTYVKDNYPWQEGLAIRGYKRRADIEVDLPAIAAKYVGAEAQAEPNRTGGWFHRVLRIGDVALLACRVRNRKSMVKKSLFMHDLAQENRQLDLPFSRKRKKVVQIDSAWPRLTAVIVHGYKKGDKSRPDFVLLRIPDGDCKNWIATIDLFALFKDALTDFYSKPAAAADRAKTLRLRKHVVKKEKTKGEGA